MNEAKAVMYLFILFVRKDHEMMLVDQTVVGCAAQLTVYL